MFDELKNLDFDTYSGSELLALIRQTLPTVITFVKANQKLLSKDKTNQSLCDNCDKADTCKEPCKLLKALLPGKYKGKGYKEKTIGIRLEKFEDINTNQPDPHEEKKSISNRDKLKMIKTTRLTDVYEEYKKCQHLFTDKQWQAIILRYEDGMTQKQIAEVTCKKRSSVSDILKRAKNMKEEYNRALRAEKINFLRNKNAE